MADDIQSSIQSLLETLVSEGKETGVQVAVYRHGKQIVDAWAGVAEPRNGRKVEADTLFPVFSTGKGMMSVLIHQLAERGQIGYEVPIAEYWPEFAAEGKGGITVRHALTHTSGLPGIPAGATQETLCDWTAICALLAAAKPETPAGAKMQYHGVTFGWLLGEVARRVDGRPVSQLIVDELALPLGLTTMFIGLPAEMEPRVAELEEIFENGPPQARDPIRGEPAKWMNRSDSRRACIPGSNGIMNARAVARFYAALLPGGVDGVELLPQSRVALATEEQTFMEREGNPPRGLGFILGMGGFTTGFGHDGYGGSAGFGDPASGLAVGIARNRFSKWDLTGRVVQRLRHGLGLG